MSWLDDSDIETALEKQAEALENNNDTHKSYLLKTDWYVTRYSETGKAVPGDVLTKRAAARAAIS